MEAPSGSDSLREGRLEKHRKDSTPIIIGRKIGRERLWRALGSVRRDQEASRRRRGGNEKASKRYAMVYKYESVKREREREREHQRFLIKF